MNTKWKITPGLMFALWVQPACLLVILFVPFGFDKPSSWGLDFGHLLIVAGAYILSLLCGVVNAGIQKRWNLLAVQLMALVVAVGLVFGGLTGL